MRAEPGSDQDATALESARVCVLDSSTATFQTQVEAASSPKRLAPTAATRYNGASKKAN
jgi:hypothetical protein